MRMKIVLAGAATLLCTAAALAADPAQAPAKPAALQALIDCRTISDQGQRLACYDGKVADLQAAEARKDLVVVDRAQIRKTRRTLFGLALPNLSVFGDDNEDQEGVSQIDGTIKAATQTPYGKWIFTLDDGARWVQTDSRELAVDPRVGQSIKVRKAAMGSYLANVNGQVAIRVERYR